MDERADQVVIRLPQALAEHAGGARVLTLDVAGSSSLADVLDALHREAPAVGRRVQDETGAIRRFVNVYVGDDECRTRDRAGHARPGGNRPCT